MKEQTEASVREKEKKRKLLLGEKIGIGVLIVFFILIIVWFIRNSKQQTPLSGDWNPLEGIIDNNASSQPTSQGKVEVKSNTLNQNHLGLGSPEIVGEVVNNTSQGVYYVKVMATYYDENNIVIGVAYTYAGDTPDTALEPQKTAPFDITTGDKIQPDHYKLDVSWR